MEMDVMIHVILSIVEIDQCRTLPDMLKHVMMGTRLLMMDVMLYVK